MISFLDNQEIIISFRTVVSDCLYDYFVSALKLSVTAQHSHRDRARRRLHSALITVSKHPAIKNAPSRCNDGFSFSQHMKFRFHVQMAQSSPI